MVLAGCSGDDDDGTGTTGAPRPSGTTSPNPTGPAPTTGGPPASGSPTSSPTENRAPTASLAASIEEGEVPFNVTFTVDGADEDGDDLTWSLDADGDGEADAEGDEVPAEYVHTFAAAGDHTATLTVSDGAQEATASVDITADEGGPTGPVEVFDGGWTAGVFGCALRSTVPGGDDDGVQYLTYVFEPESVGRPFTSTTTVGTGVATRLNMIFANDAGDVVETYGVGPPTTPGPHTEVTFTGVVPEGATWIFWGSCGGADFTVHYEVS